MKTKTVGSEKLSVPYIISCLIIILCEGCHTPNLLNEIAPLQPQFDFHAFGSNAEEIELPIDENESLNGVFIDAGEGAPVVLHLLAGGDTLTSYSEIAGKNVWIGDAVFELLDLGVSSLVFDYRGVGRSDGKQNSKQLPVDAHVAWEEALRRVDGDSKKIGIRAISLGTLAAASLLEEGANPKVTVLIAPLRAETIAVNWLRIRQSSLAAFFSELVMNQPLSVDLEREILSTKGFLTIVFGTRDKLLSSTERKLLRVAAHKAGAMIIDRDQEHLPLVRDAHHLLPKEQTVYSSLLHKIDEEKRGLLGRSTFQH